MNSPKQPITLEEWQAFVRSDPEMRMDNFCEATLETGEVLRVEEPGIAVWTKWSRNGVDGGMAWIYWENGEVRAKTPDHEIRAKLHAIASALGGRVQGDDGEYYGPTGDLIDS